MSRKAGRFLYLFLLPFALVSSLLVAAPQKKASGAKTVKKKPATTKTLTVAKKPIKATPQPRTRRARRSYSPWSEPSYADSTLGDQVDGEDLVVRRAAVDALGAYNGSVVVTDPQTGRILSMVNQKLALKSGFQPCSTIKVVAALAGLIEGLIDRTTVLPARRVRMNLTTALARSDNPYFANVGVKLGFERVSYYARLFGLGEPAGLGIEGEQPGTLPETPPPGGLGMMTSFGEGISLTPLQLASLLSTIANGGTLYWLQYPRTPGEATAMIPQVKRHLEIQSIIPEVKPGMMGAVEFGTARRAAYDPTEPILGKTGTCTHSDQRTHLGWFGSFNDVGKNKLVVVVLLTGGRPVNGPVAAGIAGNVYKNLSHQRFFAQARPISPAALVSTQACCAQ